MRHKVGILKVRQITIISYSPVNQIKLYTFRQRNDRKLQQFRPSKINKTKQHVLQKYTVIWYLPICDISSFGWTGWISLRPTWHYCPIIGQF